MGWIAMMAGARSVRRLEGGAASPHTNLRGTHSRSARERGRAELVDTPWTAVGGEPGGGARLRLAAPRRPRTCRTLSSHSLARSFQTGRVVVVNSQLTIT